MRLKRLDLNLEQPRRLVYYGPLPTRALPKAPGRARKLPLNYPDARFYIRIAEKNTSLRPDFDRDVVVGLSSVGATRGS